VASPIIRILYFKVHGRENLESRHTDGAADAAGGPAV
jgi:hypothetical protein